MEKSLFSLFVDGTIDKYYMQFFKPLCVCDCMKPLYSNSKLTRIYCKNPECINRKAKRLENICKYLKIDGFSKESLKPLVKELPYKKLLYPALIENPPSPYREIGEWLKNTEHSAEEVVEMLQIPGVKTYASKVFRNIRSAKHLVECLQSCSIEEFVARQLGRRVTDIVIKISNEIIEHMEEIMLVLHNAKLTNTYKTFYVAITDDITRVKSPNHQRLTRDEFIKYLNKIGGGFVRLKESNALASVEYIISDSNYNTRKRLKGIERDVLVTSDKFLQIFLEEVKRIGTLEQVQRNSTTGIRNG